MKKIQLAIIIFLTGFTLFAASPEKKQVPQAVKITENCSYFKLENGLTVFFAENHSVPLVYIEIAVKTGAITQNRQNAGLFHLYEHMMFKGNNLYPDSASVQKALKEMGTGSWNGTTGIECVNYFFTIPKQQLYTGLNFWNYAIRFPLMDENEFEVEKKVVISEIQGNISSPERTTGAFINSHLFKDAPWQLDPSGSVENVKNAKVSDLKKIKDTFYIPENAALFIGGDASLGEVYSIVKELFGNWENNGVKLTDIENTVEKQTKTPFEKPFLAVVPYDKMSKQFSQVSVYFRGPDADFEPEDTYAADLFHYYLGDPESDYTKAMVSDSTFLIPSSEYIGSGYSTRRRTGCTSFTCVMRSPEKELYSRAVKFLEKINLNLSERTLKDNIISQENRKKIIRRLKDDRIYETETATGLLSVLRYNWITNDMEYYKNYISNVEKVTDSDIRRYFNNYIHNKNPIIVVYVNPELYKASKTEYDKLGFVEITPEEAFWFNKK